MRRSASGRSRLALVSVVVMLPCSNSAVARLANIKRSCAGPLPRRGPLVGVGICPAPLVLVLGLARSCERSEQLRAKLVLLGFREAGVAAVRRFVVALVAVGADDGRRVEPGRAVLEGEAHRVQLALDLVDGLGAEVSDVHEVSLAARDELADRVDALALEAVV